MARQRIPTPAVRAKSGRKKVATRNNETTPRARHATVLVGPGGAEDVVFVRSDHAQSTVCTSMGSLRPFSSTFLGSVSG